MSSKTTATASNRLTEKEVDDHLRGKALARVGTIHDDESIWMTPLWFFWDEGSKVFWLTFENTRRRHVQNLRRKKTITVCVDEDPRVDGGGLDRGAWAIVARGEGDVIDDWEVIPGVLRKILTGAIGAEDTERYMAVLEHDDRVVVRVTPRDWLTWDYNKG